MTTRPGRCAPTHVDGPLVGVLACPNLCPGRLWCRLCWMTTALSMPLRKLSNRFSRLMRTALSPLPGLHPSPSVSGGWMRVTARCLTGFWPSARSITMKNLCEGIDVVRGDSRSVLRSRWRRPSRHADQARGRPAGAPADHLPGKGPLPGLPRPPRVRRKRGGSATPGRQRLVSDHQDRDQLHELLHGKVVEAALPHVWLQGTYLSLDLPPGTDPASLTEALKAPAQAGALHWEIDS